MATLGALEFPVHINFDVTFRCNAACSFCYIVDRPEAQAPHIDVERAERILETIADAGALRVNFFGGEPLLFRQLPRLISAAKLHGLRTTLITNGLLLTSSFCDAVDGALDTLAVSIHGWGDRHDAMLGVPGAFNKTLAHLQTALSRNLDVGINYTIVDGSDAHFENDIDRLCETGPIRFVSANRFIGGRDKNDKLLTPSIFTLNRVLEAFERLERRHPSVTFAFAIYFPLCLVENPSHRRYLKACGAGFNYCSVDFEGNMRLCSYANGTVGNVLLQDPRDLWRDSPLLTEYRRAEWVPSACNTCSLFGDCLTGCRVSDPRHEFGPDILLSLHPVKPVDKSEGVLR